MHIPSEIVVQVKGTDNGTFTSQNSSLFNYPWTFPHTRGIGYTVAVDCFSVARLFVILLDCLVLSSVLSTSVLSQDGYT